MGQHLYVLVYLRPCFSDEIDKNLHKKQLVESLLWWRTFHWPPKFKKVWFFALVPTPDAFRYKWNHCTMIRMNVSDLVPLNELCSRQRYIRKRIVSLGHTLSVRFSIFAIVFIGSRCAPWAMSLEDIHDTGRPLAWLSEGARLFPCDVIYTF